MINIPELDEAILHFNGVWPSTSNLDALAFADCKSCMYYPYYLVFQSVDSYFATKEQFLQRAKELGFVGKYRWGVEYATEGKKPDLPDDVLVSVAGKFINGNWYMYEFSTIGVDWDDCIKFKIIDQQYKPQDTSYLNVQEETSEMNNHWWDYDKGCEVGKAPTGTICEGLNNHNWYKVEVLKYHPQSGAYACHLLDTTIDGKNLLWFGNVRPLDYKDKIVEKQALALYRSVNYNTDMSDVQILNSVRFKDYVKAIKDGWTHPNVSA
jgi:hypothetical protein